MSTEGASQSVPGTCTDKAGRAAPASVTVSIDKTAPTITGAPTSAANGDGWYNSDVSIKWTCVDALSGIVACPVNSLISTEGTNMSAGGSVSDRAGNPASAAITGINLDKTKPTNVAFIGGTANGGIYYYSFVPAAPTCTANGGLSGLKDCVVSGYSTALGSHTLTATATDRAGNVETATLTYTVNNWTIAGFYQPIDMDGTLNIVKGGFTVPLKFEILAGNTELTETSAVKGFSAVPVSCSPSSVTDDIEFTTTGGSTLRYDITAGQFVQNWQTPKSSGTCYRATLTTQDGSTKTAYLLLK